jgi:uncharacterized membrane protein YbhN (UPF0104 family)
MSVVDHAAVHPSLRSIGSWLRRRLSVPVIVATLAALALFGYVVDIGSHGDLLGGLGAVVGRAGWLALLLAIPYFGLRALTWGLLLAQVGVRASPREIVAAFCAGELTKSLPLGVYLETYVLARLRSLSEPQVVGAAVATTGLDMMIGAVVFVSGMAIGLPGAPWFRGLLVGLAVAWLIVYGAVWAAGRRLRPSHWVLRSRLGRALVRIIREAASGIGRLLRPGLLRPLATTSGYLLILVAVLWLALDALGFGWLGIGAAVSVVVITNLVNVMLPIPVELGITEITGVGILAAWGVDPRDAAIAMLGYRVLTTGALTLVILGVLAFLHLAPSEV